MTSEHLLRKFVLLLFTLTGLASAFVARGAVSPRAMARSSAGLSKEKLASIADVVQDAIQEGQTPGAVVLIGSDGKVVYRRAFGHRALVPQKLPMTVDTIFDMASLTKVMATTTAVMQLVEQGQIRLDDPVANYWPEFKANGKEEITVRELMTHYSGLRPDLDLKPPWSGYDTAMKMIVAEQPAEPPGARFIYSDINFETLGELVRRVSGQSLDVYCHEHIFRPLGMKHTGFNPLKSHLVERKRIAPTQYQLGATGKMLWGEVHDPTAYNMGGVAGHAGLFSTADDVAIFAQMLLDGGTYNGAHILSPLTVEKMTSPEGPPSKPLLRGLGWDIDSPFSSNRGDLFPVGSYGHTGFTGTSLWVDPISKTYVVILTNRVHPSGRGDVGPLRDKIATVAAAALGRPVAERLAESGHPLTGYFELAQSYRAPPLRNGNVQTGIDVLEGENFAPLVGQKVGVITNHSGRDASGRRTIDLLAHAPGVNLVAILSPEHGLAGTADARVPSGVEPVTGLPVYSLYGDVERPTDEMLNGLDALVYDIQDAGVRFYTFITTLGYALEAAGKKGIAFYVLDRPNPINGFSVQGPTLDDDQRSFVGYFPMPVRHGMTVGELAQMYNAENHLGVKVNVIKMRGWERADWFSETGLEWINPSPNLRNLTEATLYPGVGMLEYANLSVGRGTDTPFEILGAPWIDAKRLAGYLNERKIQGVRFVPVNFTPRENRFANEVCHGIQISVLDRQALDSPELGVEISAALRKLFPQDFDIDKNQPLVGAHWVVEAIKEGHDPRRIVYRWQDALAQFRRMRSKYLLY